MILKIVEGIYSKDTFYLVKTVVDLSIFFQLPFFNNYFLKLPQKLKKPPYWEGSCWCYFDFTRDKQGILRIISIWVVL